MMGRGRACVALGRQPWGLLRREENHLIAGGEGALPGTSRLALTPNPDLVRFTCFLQVSNTGLRHLGQSLLLKTQAWNSVILPCHREALRVPKDQP